MLGKWGKYRLVAVLGRGGMAEVFEASKTGPADFVKRVCIKQIRQDLSDDPDFVQMFEHEARVAATLQHPNIVQVFDFDSHEDRLFLELELVDGLDLRRLLHALRELGATAPVGLARQVAAGLLAALAHAHGRVVSGEPAPVIHRDVAPSNILISIAGEVKLADFGIAKAHGGAATEVGKVKGKLAYSSPEQARGDKVGPASDLFGVGLVLYELLAGQRFNRGGDQAGMVGWAMNPPDPRLPWLSDEWNELLARLLTPQPADRFASAEEALAALRLIAVEEEYGADEVGRLVERTRALLGLPSLAESPGGVDDGPTRISSSKIPAPPPAEPRKGRYTWVKAALAFAAALGLFLLASELMRSATDDAEPAGQGMGAGEPDAGRAPPAVAAVDRAEPADAAPVEQAVDAGVDAGQGADRAAVGAQGPGFGRLEVNCRPWARVLVDGRDVGTTPIRKLRLPAGKRRVTLVNRELGYEQTFPVDVPRGGTASLSRDLAAEE